ncbi:VanW family protein [Bacillus dakarensis]|uniref:VanW family protein n=1 Tax=Robertmurraya dakarensis TaxID=1926278 RepID=UPI000980ED81|nr:VanW family protein [Bacillus dakarensis]
MRFSWMLAFLLLVQQSGPAINLVLEEKGDVIAVVNREEFTMPVPGLETVVNREKLNELLDQLDQQIRKPAVNASLDHFGRIIPEQAGYKFNREAFLNQFYEYFYSNSSLKIEVPTSVIYPRVDSELLSDIKVKRIGQYITYYNSRNTSRAKNISLAVEAINNQVVFPGESFSFNKIVGKRTEARGYMKAPEIIKGKVIEGIGGGICQVSSTLFNAIDRSGVKIIERYSHSKRVPYVPPGRDATVSWYGPDFIFKNDYNQPILIRARAMEGKVVVFIYSSEDINYEPKNVPGGLFNILSH